VTGQASGGEIAEGDSVTTTVNGTDYSTSVEADGSFSLEIAGSDLVADTDFTVDVESSHSVDTQAEAGSVSVDSITADDVINASEAGETITITGQASGGEIAEGDLVTLSVNNQDYTTQVQADGSYAVEVNVEDLATDANISVSVASNDETGNQVVSTASATHDIQLDDEASASTASS